MRKARPDASTRPHWRCELGKRFVRFANRVAEASGFPSVFIVAVLTVLIWLATGPFFHFPTLGS
jgi:hypothetical protein